VSNKEAGTKLQEMIADGTVKGCTAISKATGEVCKRAARCGYDVCSVHGAGTNKREALAIRKPPGRPVIHGMYSEKLRSPGEEEAYNQFLGDLTLVQEAALAKVKLFTFLDKMIDEKLGECTIPDEDECMESPRKSRLGNKSIEEYFVKMLEAVVKTTSAAYEQLQDKKIVVSLQQDSTVVLEEARKIVNEEMDYISGMLCSECKSRIADSLRDKQQIVIEG